MRTRVAPLATVVAFALAVAIVAALAGRGGGGQDLIKLPFASSAGGAEDAAASTASRTMLAPAFGGFEYKVAGTLPELPSTAPGYQLGTTTTAAAVRALAEALGLDGEVVEKDGAWVVTAGGKELRVDEAPGLPWYLGPSCPEQPVSSDGPADLVARFCGQGVAVGSGSGLAPAPEPAPAVAEPVCKVTPTGEVCSAASPTVAVASPAPVPSPTVAACKPDATDCAVPPPVDTPVPVPLPAPDPPARPAGFPTREAAERQARDLFDRLGVGTVDFAMDDGWLTWEARVEPNVDGLPVFGLWHSVSIGAGGEVERANGYLARPERIGDYPLVGVAKGLERLKNPATMSAGGAVATDVATFEATGETIEPATTVVDGDSTAGSVGSAGAGVSGITAEEAAKLEAERREAEANVDCADPTVRCQTAPPPDLVVDPLPPVPVEPVVQTITGVHLALMQIDAVLVPVYVFELEEGGETFPVPAVTDEWLQEQAPSVAAVKD